MYTKEYFDYMLERRGTKSSQWDGCNAKFGEDPSVEMLPMWVADMDSSTTGNTGMLTSQSGYTGLRLSNPRSCFF